MLQFVAASSQHLDSVSAITPPNPGTICFWWTPTTITNQQMILYNDATFRIVLGFTTASHIQTYLYRKANRPLDSTMEFVAGTKYHITCTWNDTGSTVNTLYVNAVQDNTGSDTHGTPPSATLCIGYDSTSNYLNATLDDIRMYNRILNLDEIQTIYAANGCDGIIYGLLYCWIMNEKHETSTATGAGTIIDETATLNLTPTNSPTYVGSLLKTSRRLSGG